MVNAAAARAWIERALGAEALRAPRDRRHRELRRGAATWGLPECNVFPFADWVGGRFSLWSSVGLPVAIARRHARASSSMLAGAHAVDLAFRSDPLEHNVPALMALVGVWNRNALGCASHAVLPLRLAPRRACRAYLQQLEMESNGKRVDREGNPRRFRDLPGGAGRRGHARASTPSTSGCTRAPIAVSCDFIVVARADGRRRRAPRDPARARLRAVRGADGRASPRPSTHKACPGDRAEHHASCCPRSTPSTSARCSRSTSTRCSCRASLWGINSFDQCGVELGKTIAGAHAARGARRRRASLHPATHHLLGVIQKLAGAQPRPPMATEDFKRIFESLRVAVVVADAAGQAALRQRGLRAARRARVRASSRAPTWWRLFAADDRKRVTQNVARVGEGKAGHARSSRRC